MTFHFIGLGGIGMSALARVLLQRGQRVQGSDVKASALLEELKSEGADVKIGHDGAFVQPGATIIYSSDIKNENIELIRAKELRLPILHRSDLLHQLMETQKPLLVAGTHGKTTTTALLASVLIEAKMDPSFVVGGILRSEKTNGRAGKGEYFVAEADESDGSFLKTPAFGAIVTNVEKEHLDYWKTEEHLYKGFKTFFKQANHPSHLLWCLDDPHLAALNPHGISYGFSPKAACCITSYTPSERGIRFSLTFQDRAYENIELSLHGRHNALNGSAVFALALTLGVDESAIRRAFQMFGGTMRRLDKIGSVQNIEIYDDYGHHPTEIAATLRALRDVVREKRLIAVVQPHRYTRVRDLGDEFLHCFDDADEIFLTDIFAAGEAPIEGVTSAALYARLREKLGSRVKFSARQHLEASLAAHVQVGDVILTLGAGDITKAARAIYDKIAERAPKLTIALLFGGTSAEHEVALSSARVIQNALDPALYDVKLFGLTKEGVWIDGADAMEKLEQQIRIEPGAAKIDPAILASLSSCDVCIPVFHGPQGEDGMVQGLLEALGVPYAGCDYRSGALCMQKAWTKYVALMNGIPTPKSIEFDRLSWKREPERLAQKIRESLQYPVWVKAVHLGSSIGVMRVENESQLSQAAEHAFHYDDMIIAEEEIAGRQIEIGLVGNDFIRTALPLEVLHSGFLSYDKKYGPNAAKYRVPADLTPTQTQIGLDLARRVYECCGCKGLARIDFFIDPNGHFWLNEVNPFPGCTPTSAYPHMWQVTGVTMREICNDLIVLAFHRHRRLAEMRAK